VLLGQRGQRLRRWGCRLIVGRRGWLLLALWGWWYVLCSGLFGSRRWREKLGKGRLFIYRGIGYTLHGNGLYYLLYPTYYDTAIQNTLIIIHTKERLNVRWLPLSLSLSQPLISAQLLKSPLLLRPSHRILHLHNPQPPHPLKQNKQPLRLPLLLLLRHQAQLPLRPLMLLRHLLSRHGIDIRPAALVLQVRGGKGDIVPEEKGGGVAVADGVDEGGGGGLDEGEEQGLERRGKGLGVGVCG